MRLPPSGRTLASLITPSLLVSLPVLERNEAACRTLVRGTGVQLRPHAKAHKSSGLARWLLTRAGDEVSGLCAQTVDEAEVMIGTAQCMDVLLTNEVIGTQKLDRIAGLAASHPDAAIGVLVDSLPGVDALSAAMRAHAPSATISAYIEIECGQDRCGVPAASPAALAIAQAVAAAPGLRLGGLHVYHGGIQHVRTTAERRAAVANGPAAAARATAAQLRAAGLEVCSMDETGLVRDSPRGQTLPQKPTQRAHLPQKPTPRSTAPPEAHPSKTRCARHRLLGPRGEVRASAGEVSKRCRRDAAVVPTPLPLDPPLTRPPSPLTRP